MARISMLIPDEDLAAIDEFATPNRTAFMLRAVRESVNRLQRERLNLEIAACLNETSTDDLDLAVEFAGTAADGL